MPVTRSQTGFQVKPKKTLGATAHLSIFCSSGEQPNRDARWHIQEDFKKALRFRGITLLTSVIVLTPDLLAEGRTYVYVPIGEVKKVEFHNWVYASRETLTDHIKFLEAQALVLRLARIHPSTYTLPLSHIQWNVMLAINPEVKGRWEEAARRAITGSGNTVPVEPAIISGNVAYELFASEAAKAHKLATTPAGCAFARRLARTYRSPSPASDESMRTASPPPEDDNDTYVSGQFDDADDTSTNINNNDNTVVFGPPEGNIVGDDKTVCNETSEVAKAVSTSKIEIAPNHNHGTCPKDDSPTTEATVVSPVNHEATVVDRLSPIISTPKVENEEHIPILPKASVKADIDISSDTAKPLSVIDKAKSVQDPPAKPDTTITGDAPSGSKKATTATPEHPRTPTRISGSALPDPPESVSSSTTT
ncbi:hypothetical protein EHS25_009111 [Saitozyma podzolica]|uniref:Uncharacterized protein n=1 Tax=Saitozyma podzolica TaxID=1890683 RepID=A0A427YKV6_9TREE|nr:hypothetical protein EHS25_009111 [Saitozyma podzolica]